MNMNALLKQAQKMQENMAKKQEELANLKVEGTAGGGMVKVIANGNQEILGIELEKEVIDPEDKEMLEDLIVAAVNQALKTAQEKAGSEMKGALGGLDLPENFKIPGL
jgi:DNA-binding YbaB/EbfC family protein